MGSEAEKPDGGKKASIVLNRKKKFEFGAITKNTKNKPNVCLEAEKDKSENGEQGKQTQASQGKAEYRRVIQPGNIYKKTRKIDEDLKKKKIVVVKDISDNKKTEDNILT